MTERHPLTPMDAMFLWGERPDTMFHVAGLLPFTPPPDAGPSYLRDLIRETREHADVQPPWNRKLRHPRLLASPFHYWVNDREMDLDYHLRHSALASPGDERELGVLISRLHSHQLDMTRPPWELHVIEGLERGRFALYVKIHHALVDGFSAMRILVRSMSTDPEERDRPLFFSTPPERRPRTAADDSDFLSDVGSLVSSVRRQAGAAVTLTERILSPLIRPGANADLVGNVSAPHTILNGRIGRNRRFSTQQYDLERLKAVGSHYDATVNDVVMAIAGGGLRKWLGELGELPDKPLVAFLPVNVRAKGDVGGGNAVGAILATLATDTDDPADRIERITASTQAAKAQLEGMTQEAILAYSAYVMSPLGLQGLSAITGIRTPIPLTFNVCISNVPGPDHPLYLRGSRLEAAYPVSIPMHSMALNITVQSYAGTLCVGFIGDRDALPHLQRLAVHTGAELAALEAAAGLN